MSGHTTRLERDLEAIRSRVAGIGERVGNAVRDAVASLLNRDVDAGFAVVLDDLPINRDVRALDADCHRFVARHLPAAGHLRFVSAVLRLDIALERIGDYAVTIGRVGARLDGPIPDRLRSDIQRMADQSIQMLQLAIRAFVTGDAELARETKALAPKIDTAYDQVFGHLMDQDREVLEIVRLLAVYDRLERVSDQAKNVCEETMFVVSGETKAPKRYRVLFVDQDNAMWSQLAEALARKSFTDKGTFRSAGLTPAAALDPRLADAAEELSVDVGLARVAGMPEMVAPPTGFHVVVSIGLEVHEILPQIDFHTALVRWPAPDAADVVGAARQLSAGLADLMETLRGDT